MEVPSVDNLDAMTLSIRDMRRIKYAVQDPTD